MKKKIFSIFLVSFLLFLPKVSANSGILPGYVEYNYDEVLSLFSNKNDIVTIANGVVNLIYNTDSSLYSSVALYNNNVYYCGYQKDENIKQNIGIFISNKRITETNVPLNGYANEAQFKVFDFDLDTMSEVNGRNEYCINSSSYYPNNITGFYNAVTNVLNGTTPIAYYTSDLRLGKLCGTGTFRSWYCLFNDNNFDAYSTLNINYKQKLFHNTYDGFVPYFSNDEKAFINSPINFSLDGPTADFYNKPLKINGTLYVMENGSYKKLPMITENLITNNVYEQLYSYDYLINEADYNTFSKTQYTEFKTIADNTKATLGGFYFYGEANNSGVISYDYIPSGGTGCSVNDYTSTKNGMRFNTSVEGIVCNQSVIDTYDKIYMRMTFNNAFNITSMNSDNGYKNTIQDKYIFYKFTNFDFNDILTLTTNKAIYNYRSYYSDIAFFNGSYSAEVVGISKMNTETGEDIESFISTNSAIKNNAYQMNTNVFSKQFGTDDKSGLYFYLNSNAPEDLSINFYLMFAPTDYANGSNTTISFLGLGQKNENGFTGDYVNNEGNIIDNGQVIADLGTSVYKNAEFLTIINNTIKGLENYSSELTETKNLVQLFFDSFGTELKTIISLSYSMIMIYCIWRWWNK